MALSDVREFYAKLIAARAGVEDARVIAAFASVERERFVGAGPWRVFAGAGYLDTPTADPSFVYQDLLVSLAEDRGINNGEPSLHARCIAALNPQPGEHLVHVGAGTGYYTALLSKLVGSEGRIDAYEIEPDLAARARAALADQENVQIHGRSATEGPLPDADAIYVSAGAAHPPRVWLDALGRGGRLLFPLTAAQGGVMMLLTKRSADLFDARVLCGAAFIPCIGATDPNAAASLLKALAAGRVQNVRALHLRSRPDETCWLAGDDWWFSTREIGA